MANPSEGYFSVHSIRRLSNIEQFDISESEPIVNLESEFNHLSRELDIPNIQLDPLSEMDESEGLEFFDGFRATRPLFVYDASFGPKQFDQTLSELSQISRMAFDMIIEEINVDIEEIEETAGGKETENSEDTGTKGFQ